jgi:excisionase family DNA binding protein
MFADDLVRSLEEGDLLSIDEAARILRVSPVTVWRMVKSGALPAIRVGTKRVRIRKVDLAGVVHPVARPDTIEPPLEAGAALLVKPARIPCEDDRRRVASRILSRREEIGPIEESTTELIDEGIAKP